MTGLRRALVLVLAAVTVTLGLTSPASAAYSDTATMTSTASTLKVAPPTSLSTAGTKCETSYDAATMRYTTTLHAKASWVASPTRGVSGYLVVAVFSDGSTYPVAQVAAPATSVTGDYDAYYATQNIRVIVMTLTSYGWTAASSLSGVIKC
jgi:hypothetical protein